MYNFLEPKLSPKVSSSAAALDSYEVTNLISENFIIKSRGFVAHTIIKPPVDITFELICPINIHYMILWTTLGNQKCTSLEIFARTNNKEFRSIATANFTTNGIIFCNNRIYSVNNPPENIDQSFHLCFFKHTAFRSFTTASNIKVRILRTERTVPCLGKIEIWGKPSKMCSSVTINTIDRLMQKPLKVVNEGTSELKHKNAIEEWRVPEEFKDTITYEVMAIPITLPSGNTVDQSTLEKYIQNEASYGRSASDPFTGQKFTDTRKPVFNAALKTRIDMFLIKNSNQEETFTIKRTLGNKININDTQNKFNGIKRDLNDNLHKEAKKIKSNNNELMVVRNVKYNDLDENLNDAINKTINSSNFTNFTDEANVVSTTDTKSECVKCKSDNNLYVVPCNHLYCRNCLLDVCKSLKCEECGQEFSKSDPKKFHYKTN